MGNHEIAAKIYDMIVSKIKEYGWIIQASHNDEFPFIYSIGLYPKYGFELVMAGLHPEMMGGIMQGVVRKFDKIEEFGKDVELITNGFVRFYQCPREDGDQVTDIVCQADNYFGMNVPVVQIIVGTIHGEFFDTPDVDAQVKNQQPLLFAHPTPPTVH